ncbi:MAG: hypothetical protein PHY12_15140 [Eubacteriales bacterium]|nr:hypothetical protein [Eubacteriales bacterium]
MSKPKKTTGGRLWVRLMKGHKAARDLLLPCERDDVLGALREAMHQLDLSMPVWLPRHEADWEQFGLTRLLPEHFIDPVDFDRMEISYIAPEEEKKKKRGFEQDFD